MNKLIYLAVKEKDDEKEENKKEQEEEKQNIEQEPWPETLGWGC
jgi:hypothetical protein